MLVYVMSMFSTYVCNAAVVWSAQWLLQMYGGIRFTTYVHTKKKLLFLLDLISIYCKSKRSAQKLKAIQVGVKYL
jgi:hypothetical protein